MLSDTAVVLVKGYKQVTRGYSLQPCQQLRVTQVNILTYSH